MDDDNEIFLIKYWNLLTSCYYLVRVTVNCCVCGKCVPVHMLRLSSMVTGEDTSASVLIATITGTLAITGNISWCWTAGHIIPLVTSLTSQTIAKNNLLSTHHLFWIISILFLRLHSIPTQKSQLNYYWINWIIWAIYCYMKPMAKSRFIEIRWYTNCLFSFNTLGLCI